MDSMKAIVIVKKENSIYHIGMLKLEIGKSTKNNTIYVDSMLWEQRDSLTQKSHFEEPQNYIPLVQLPEVYSLRFRKSAIKRIYEFFNSTHIWVHIKKHTFN
jgi:hypothetical protein